jgi:hypothetical protein
MVKEFFSRTVAPSMLKPLVDCAVAVPEMRSIKQHVQKQEAIIYVISLFICINFILVSGFSSFASLSYSELFKFDLFDSNAHSSKIKHLFQEFAQLCKTLKKELFTLSEVFLYS